jgi:CheY-like chemotaxis protein
MSALQGRRILCLEDEPIVAMTLEDMLIDLGAEVVGPVGSIPEALALAEGESLDAALLDINIRGERSYAVAEALKARGIPMVFATGYGESGWDGAPDAPILDKPYTQRGVALSLGKVLGAGA